MTGHKSCLVTKLSHYVELSPRDHDLLTAFEAEQREYRKRDLVRREGDEVKYLFVVKKGWFYGHSLLPSGKRQVHRLYLPGDLIGTQEVVCKTATVNVSAASKGILCPFEKAGLKTVFVESPRLTALLYSIEALDQVTQDDRLRSIARMDAAGRLAHFFLQVFSRLSVAGEQQGDTLKVEMSQELIGDALGLTGIHVNRTFRQLSEDGLISLDNGSLTLRDREALKSIAAFDDRHYRIDTSWFPG